MVFASRHQYSSASKSYDQTTKIERKFNCRPLERIQEPHLPLNRFVTMITVALENGKRRLYHLTLIVYIIIRSLAFYCPTHCLQPFGQDYKRSQPVWISCSVRRCAKKYSIGICQLIPGLYMHAFKFEKFQETEIGESKKFLSQSMPPSKPSCLAKKSGRNKKWDTCSGNDGSWMKSVNRKTQPTSTWKKKHISIYKSSFRSNFATHFLKIKKNPMGTIWNDETIHWFQRYSTWTTKPWRISTSSDLNESPRRDLDRFFSIPAAMGRSPVLEEIRNLETKIREKNKQICRFGGCLPDFRESFFYSEPAVN